MKQQIRFNTFETNSSSTHSCVICTKDELKKWQNGEMLASWEELLTKEEVEERFKDYMNKYYPDVEKDSDEWEEHKEDFMLDFKDYDSWGEDYEHDTTTRTINGEEVIVECYFGYDN